MHLFDNKYLYGILLCRYDIGFYISLMKTYKQKVPTEREDDLFGLLAMFKANATYIRILESEEESLVSLQLTGNPGNWKNLPEERYETFRQLRRIELGVSKLMIKYISPEHIVSIRGPLLGLKLPLDKMVVINSLEENGIYIIEAPLKYKSKMLTSVKKLVNLTPQKKYEILEKCLAQDQE